MSEILKPLMVPIISLPDNLGNMTVNELLCMPDTEITKKGNKLQLRRITNFGTATLEINTYDTNIKTVFQSSVPSHPGKKELLPDIIRMKKAGVLQKDIAFQLGISESYVTKLLKEMKDSED